MHATLQLVIQTPLSRSKSRRSRLPGRFAHHRVGASGGCSGGRGNVLAVENCCYVAVCSAAQGASAPTGVRLEGRGNIVAAARLPLVFNCTVADAIYRRKTQILSKLQHRDNTLLASFSSNMAAEITNLLL